MLNIPAFIKCNCGNSDCRTVVCVRAKIACDADKPSSFPPIDQTLLLQLTFLESPFTAELKTAIGLSDDESIKLADALLAGVRARVPEASRN